MNQQNLNSDTKYVKLILIKLIKNVEKGCLL